MLIKAVNDDRFGAIQFGRCGRRQRFQRQRVSAREMLLDEDRIGQNIDELRSSCDESLGPGNINSLRHEPTSTRCERA